jgi:alkylhydroperoxidase family enzyme
MPWIHTVPPDDAKGPLARIYRAAVQRAGKVFHILRVQSLNPPVLRSSIALYKDVMFGESPLDRATREMIAVVVSRANDCHY